jgi:hypothetical protein
MKIEIDLVEAWGDHSFGEDCTDARGAAQSFIACVADECRELWPEATVRTRLDDICGGPEYSVADVRAEEGENRDDAVELEREIETTLRRDWNHWYEGWVESDEAAEYY